MNIKWSDANEAAKECAGNWRKWHSFASGLDLTNPDNWFIFYTHNRDSRLLELSNAQVWTKIVEKYEYDIKEYNAFHFLVGWVEGYRVRVYRDYKHTKLTPAFIKVCETFEKLESYPILDEDVYSQLELEATSDNLEQELRWVISRHDLDVSPKDLVDQAYTYLSEHYNGWDDNIDDQGGWPKTEHLEEFFRSIELLKDDDDV
jgi:hypothetical protein